MNARESLHKSVEAGKHSSTRKIFGKYITRARAVTSNQIVLELPLIAFADLVLRHWPKACVDSIDDFIARVLVEKGVVHLHFFQCSTIELNGFAAVQDFRKITGCESLPPD